MTEPVVERGRGALGNPSGRFERLAVISERVDDDDDRLPRETELFRDSSKSILSDNDSPDVGMAVYLNAYRGCEHGCIYCYARPYHEYLGLSAGIQEPGAGVMEPRASRPRRRLDAIAALAAAGIPVGVNVAPIVPGLTDHEVPAILKAAADAGATTAGRIVVRLPHGVKDLFSDWLEAHFPERKDKVLNRVRAMRDGRLNDPNFGSRMSGNGPFAESIQQMFDLHRRKLGLTSGPELSVEAFRRPPGPQPGLFD